MNLTKKETQRILCSFLPTTFYLLMQIIIGVRFRVAISMMHCNDRSVGSMQSCACLTGMQGAVLAGRSLRTVLHVFAVRAVERSMAAGLQRWSRCGAGMCREDKMVVIPGVVYRLRKIVSRCLELPSLSSRRAQFDDMENKRKKYKQTARQAVHVFARRKSIASAEIVRSRRSFILANQKHVKA